MIAVHVHMAWLAYGIKAQRLPGDIGLDTGKAVGTLEICGLHALWTIGIRVNRVGRSGSGHVCRGRFRSKHRACRKTQINALLVLSL
jgi:hypothetical protein